MQIKDVMTSNPEFILATCTISEAAKKMRDLDTGFLPIGDKKTDKLIGTLTDRDIAIAAIAHEKNLHEPVTNIMHEGVHYCYETDDIQKASKWMADKQVRRLIVLNKNKRLTGVVTLGDIALSCLDEKLAGQMLKKISKH